MRELLEGIDCKGLQRVTSRWLSGKRSYTKTRRGGGSETSGLARHQHNNEGETFPLSKLL
ncbi:hypothetical protein Scep_012203 [Stephania cephalantha]|uniref:Uncharacterized protein n=1 Tax=Stephania cephalantha TaxID=152367 RepID=A0AAP0JGP6_9MAGN